MINRVWLRKCVRKKLFIFLFKLNFAKERAIKSWQKCERMKINLQKQKQKLISILNIHILLQCLVSSHPIVNKSDKLNAYIILNPLLVYNSYVFSHLQTQTKINIKSLGTYYTTCINKKKYNKTNWFDL